MLAITRDVWGGHDYVPRVWSSWLRPHDGILLVAEMAGTTVGFQHVAVHPDCSAWMEGIRVREELQGRSIGTKLLVAGLDWARFSGLGTVRLSTSTENPASNRLAERAGLRVVARFASVRVLAGERSETAMSRLARPDELGELRSALDTLGDANFYTEGWTAYRLTDERLSLLLAIGQVLVSGRDHVDAVGILTATPERVEPRPGLLLGSPGGLRSILSSLQGTLLSQGVESVRGQLQVSDSMLEQLRESGLERAWEHDMALWEHQLD